MLSQKTLNGCPKLQPVIVLAEIPGVSKDHVTLNLDDYRLNLSARRGETKYQKEIILPEGFSEERMTWECNNGILKVRFER